MLTPLVSMKRWSGNTSNIKKKKNVGTSNRGNYFDNSFASSRRIATHKWFYSFEDVVHRYGASLPNQERYRFRQIIGATAV